MRFQFLAGMPGETEVILGELIDFTQKQAEKENLIVARPLEFRRGDWQSGFAIMCTRAESERYEAHRLEATRIPGHRHIRHVPNHIRLDGGYHFTTLGLYRYRDEEEKMRRVYRLAGLMECVTGVCSPILRTDLLRKFYKDILREREELHVVWRGNVNHFLLPLSPDHYNANHFHHAVVNASTLKDLFATIESETNVQFHVISHHYVFYLPEGFPGQAIL
ncbi:MAG: hypothetical protein GX422_14105 [Deltaproteobacteria bacterium]|jgi:hypothetical protein|nr:hypothetical protein [Deltaproteobacteria bacterium]